MLTQKEFEQIKKGLEIASNSDDWVRIADAIEFINTFVVDTPNINAPLYRENVYSHGRCVDVES